MASNKQPPVFNPDEGDNYEKWKNDIEIWCMLTEGKIKQGPAVYLSLNGDARDAVRAIPNDDLKKDNAVKIILDELDKVYLKDETSRSFAAIKMFVLFRRESSQSFSKFLVEFNTKYREVKKHGLDFEDGILAFFLLMAANLTNDHERLVRATADLKFDDMKDKIQKVFGEFDGTQESELHESKLPVKEGKEECFYAKESKTFQSRGTSRRGGGYFRGASRGGSFSRGAGRVGKNPRDAQGEIMRCHECDSTMHLIKDCPHRRTERSLVHLTFLTGQSSPEQNQMTHDALARAIIDCGCTRTVAGITWIEEFLAMLHPDERKKVENTRRESSTKFRFGDGNETKSKNILTLPLSIYGKRFQIPVEVVDNNIPLLLGRPSMTELRMVLDTSKHHIDIDGRKFKVDISASGHYVIPVSEFTSNNTEIVLHMENLPGFSKQEKMEKAKKLHRQFAHASKERLLKLLRDGGCEDKEFLAIVKNVCETCTFCHKYKQAKPRPVVGLPKATKFNEVVAMDLKETEKGKEWILHLVDHCTRYTAAALITSKRKDVIVKNLFKIWLAYFGAPRVFHSDCGGEFENETFKEMAEAFNIEISTTPGESPFSNGVVERGNKMLYETMLKTQEDTKCSKETALAWAVSAKNSLQNVYGYSPNQLVLGQNVTLPSVVEDQPPALDQPEKSQLVRENLNAMHKARQSYVKSEASEKIRRALKHNIRTYSEETFHPGEKVFYKIRQEKKWRGPAKVLGKESNFVLIRQGASYFRCHPCHLLKVEPHLENTQEKENTNTVISGTKESKNTDKEEEVPNEDEDTSDEEETHNDSDKDELYLEEEHKDNEEGASNSLTQMLDNENEDSHTENENTNDEHKEDGEGASNTQMINNENVPIEKKKIKEHRALRALRNLNRPGLKEDQFPHTPRNKKKENEKAYVQELNYADILPKTKTTIHLELENGTQVRANVLSKHKNVVNLHEIGKEKPSKIDWKDVVWWREVGETEHIFTLSVLDEQGENIIEAKQKELKNLKENDVFECVNDEGQQAVSCRWVYTEKENPDGSTRVKARLVARGFEEKMVNKKVDSPTCSRQGLRLGLIAAICMKWELHVMDISSAFLQGNTLKRTVYVRPPMGMCESGKIWKLKRCLYGLSDAPREWYDRVCQEMKTLGATVSLYDKSVFIWQENNNLVGVVITHVDDFEYCGTLKWQDKVIQKLYQTFKISKNEKGSFKYVGLNIEQDSERIFIDQIDYCSDLKEIQLSIERKRQLEEPLTEEEKKALKSVGGQILWTTSQTRPDSAYDGCQISNIGDDPRVKSILEANKAIRKLKTDQLKIIYPFMGKPENLKVIAYGDGSHASLPSGASQGGNLIFLSGENGKAAPIVWRSKRLDRVTKSPLATEVSAVADAADHGHLVAAMTQELFCLKRLPEIELITDSRSLQEHLESKKIIKDPRLRVDVARLREMNELGEITIKWVPSEMQLADSLTKRGASTDLLRKVLATGVLPGHLGSQH